MTWNKPKKDQSEPHDPACMWNVKRPISYKLRVELVVARGQQKLVRGAGMRSSWLMGTNLQSDRTETLWGAAAWLDLFPLYSPAAYCCGTLLRRASDNAFS